MDRIGSKSLWRLLSVSGATRSRGRGIPTEEDVLDWLENHAPRQTRRRELWPLGARRWRHFHPAAARSSGGSSAFTC